MDRPETSDLAAAHDYFLHGARTNASDLFLAVQMYGAATARVLKWTDPLFVGVLHASRDEWRGVYRDLQDYRYYFRKVSYALARGGCDLSATNYFEKTVLHSAVHDPDLTLLLLEKGSAVNAKDAKGWTPLHCALGGLDSINALDDENRFKSAEILIRAGADIGARDVDGKTPAECIPVRFRDACIFLNKVNSWK